MSKKNQAWGAAASKSQKKRIESLSSGPSKRPAAGGPGSKPLDLDTAFSQFERLVISESDVELREMEQLLKDTQAKIEAWKRMRKYQEERQAAVIVATMDALAAAAKIEPWEPELREILEPLGGWKAMQASGASDEQINAKLAKSWSEWNSCRVGETNGRGGSHPVVWIRPKSYGEKPTLEGKKLIDGVRKVMGIGLPGPGKGTEGKRDRGTKGKAGTQKQPKRAKEVKFIDPDAKEFKGATDVAAKFAATTAKSNGRFRDGVRKALRRKMGQMAAENLMTQRAVELDRMRGNQVSPADAAKSILATVDDVGQTAEAGEQLGDVAVEVETADEIDPELAGEDRTEKFVAMPEAIRDYIDRLTPNLHFAFATALWEFHTGQVKDDPFKARAYEDMRVDKLATILTTLQNLASANGVEWIRSDRPAIGKKAKRLAEHLVESSVPPLSAYSDDLPVEWNKTYTHMELGLSRVQLDAELGRDYSILPRAPRFETANVGRTGAVIAIGEHDLVVIHARHANGQITYTLLAAYPAENWEHPIQSALQRYTAHKDKSPEEIPLKGVRVEDAMGNEWILGDEKIFVVVDTNAAAKAIAAMSGPAAPAVELPVKVGDDIELGIGGDIVRVMEIKTHDDGTFDLMYTAPSSDPALQKLGLVESRWEKGCLRQGANVEAAGGWTIFVNPPQAVRDKAAKKKTKQAKKSEVGYASRVA